MSQAAENLETVYVASHTGRKLHKDKSFVRAIIGPIGSGKSVCCCWEVFKKACEQEPHNGIRKTRFVIIRNTYRELVDTTCKTWFDWFPKHMGVWRQMDMSHRIVFNLEDGTRVDTEILFRALDKPDDIKKLLSLELTGGWLNEAREIPKAVLDMLIGRVGRYPAKRDGGPSWWGVILDTNPPDEDHWFYRVFEEERPSSWAVFHQPGGRSENAENIENLPQNYYENMIPGKDQEWIKVYVDGQYGFVSNGKPVYPEYNDVIHVDYDIVFDPTRELYVGLDFGRTPAAAFAQQAVDGQWQFIGEITTDDMGAHEFGKILSKELNSTYAGAKSIEIWGDPSGDYRSQSNDDTPYIMLLDSQIDAMPAPTQDPVVRRESVIVNLTRLTTQGRPGLVISPNCRQLRKGMAGGFKYKRVQVTGEERYRDEPDKNNYSHICEAAEYLLVGAGEGYAPVHYRGWEEKLEYDDRHII